MIGVDISQLRQVCVYYQGYQQGYQPAQLEPHSSTIILLSDHVGRFAEATVKLHWDPGVNPHNGNQTAVLGAMTVHELWQSGPYWHTTPDLQNNNDPAGAIQFDWDSGRLLVCTPDFDLGQIGIDRGDVDPSNVLPPRAAG
jgi:hypothetical protein